VLDTEEVQGDRGAQAQDQPDAGADRTEGKQSVLDNLRQSSALIEGPGRCGRSASKPRAPQFAQRRPPGERKARAAKTEPNGMTAQIIELAKRRDCVTRPKLSAKVGAKAQPWTALLKS